MTELRIHKWLSQLGTFSRRQAEELIREGQVYVDGKKALLGQIINPEASQVKVSGKIQNKKKPSLYYWMLHKPDLTLVSRKKEEGFKTIYEIKSLRKMPVLLNPVGRLDYRTEGLLLLTNLLMNGI